MLHTVKAVCKTWIEKNPLSSQFEGFYKHKNLNKLIQYINSYFLLFSHTNNENNGMHLLNGDFPYDYEMNSDDEWLYS